MRQVRPPRSMDAKQRSKHMRGCMNISREDHAIMDRMWGTNLSFAYHAADCFDYLAALERAKERAQ